MVQTWEPALLPQPALPPPLASSLASVPGMVPEGTRMTLERIQPLRIIFRCRGIRFCKTWVPHLTQPLQDPPAALKD